MLTPRNLEPTKRRLLAWRENSQAKSDNQVITGCMQNPKGQACLTTKDSSLWKRVTQRAQRVKRRRICRTGRKGQGFRVTDINTCRAEAPDPRPDVTGEGSVSIWDSERCFRLNHWECTWRFLNRGRLLRDWECSTFQRRWITSICQTWSGWSAFN